MGVALVLWEGAVANAYLSCVPRGLQDLGVTRALPASRSSGKCPLPGPGSDLGTCGRGEAELWCPSPPATSEAPDTTPSGW